MDVNVDVDGRFDEVLSTFAAQTERHLRRQNSWHEFGEAEPSSPQPLRFHAFLGFSNTRTKSRLESKREMLSLLLACEVGFATTLPR